jgi:hypothetical protein
MGINYSFVTSMSYVHLYFNHGLEMINEGATFFFAFGK